MTAKANPLLDEAIRLHQAGKLDAALSLYEQVLAADPDEPAALHLKGLVALQRGDATTARPLMERAVALRDDNPVWWRNLGVCRQSLGLPAEAIAAFRRAHALQPEPANVLALAKALLTAGDPAGAIPVLERPSAAPDASFEMLRLCGYAAALAGNNELALARYQAARRLQPGDSLVLSSLGSLLFRKGEFAKAEEALAELTRLYPADASGWTARAGVALEANELERAQSCVARALALEPQRTAALLAQARIVEALGRIDEARAGYERVLALDPADSNAALALVRIDVLALPRATELALDALRKSADAPVRDRAPVSRWRRCARSRRTWPARLPCCVRVMACCGARPATIATRTWRSSRASATWSMRSATRRWLVARTSRRRPCSSWACRAPAPRSPSRSWQRIRRCAHWASRWPGRWPCAMCSPRADGPGRTAWRR